MKISRSSQTCALGAAIFGAVAGGAYRTVQQAQRRMTGVRPAAFRPNRAAARTYADLYAIYRSLHDAFGTPQGPLYRTMKDLIAIRRRAAQGDA
jgi:L-ribulokinase